MTNAEIHALFTYKSPTPEKAEKYKTISEACANVACLLNNLLPECPDRTHAVRLLQQVRMTANQAVANDGIAYR